MTKIVRVVLLSMVLALMGAGCAREAPKPEGQTLGFSATSPPAEAPVASPAPQAETGLETKPVEARLLSQKIAAFDFTVQIPKHWQVEVVPAIEALNFYDPDAPGNTIREKSQIFVRHFRANRFLTLTTVNILSRRETTIAGRPAVVYEIEKKSGIPDFPEQPAWRNEQHVVTDIRASDTNPSEFYVFGKRPDLVQELFDRVLQSIVLPDNRHTLVPPVREFLTRITKKPFGIFITPETSPVQPERFYGYHTGTDAEFDDVEGEVEVAAITEGIVERSGRAEGYGGMVAIRHTIEGKKYLAIYGHLNPNSLPRTGTRMAQGKRIGVLGAGFTEETDGERKHLHFGIYTGPDINIRGYVNTEEELKAWRDPRQFLKQ